MLKFLKIISYFFPTLAAQKALKLFLVPQRHQRPEAENIWYASSRKRFLKNGLHINEWGVEGQPKIMLVHGWEGRGTQMAAFAGPLVIAGYHVIAIDGPAHGESPGNETNAGIFSRALVEVQKELGDVRAVIAHSFGGGCSILASGFGLKVDKIVMIASPSDYAKVVRNFLDFVPLSSYSEKAFYRILSHKAQVKLEDINITTLGKNISVPVMIVHDKNDKEVGFQNAQWLHEAWPQSKLLITEGLGHRRILKDPEVIRKVVEFINE